MFDFKDKVVVVTGATSGIGKATALVFSKYGAKVAAIGRNLEKGKELCARSKKHKGEIYFFPCDVRSPEDIDDCIKKIIRKFGNINVLFNNAGVFYTGPLEKISVEEWDEMYDVNVRGYMLMCQGFLPYMMDVDGASIINNASIAGLQSYCTGRSFIYSSSKAAVIQFSRVLAQNYAEFVRVNCICPGIIETPMLGDRNREVYSERVPMKRLGDPVEVANVVLFLASEAASYLNGTVIPIDGGVSI